MNFMMEEGEDRIRAAYRANYDRLAAIKAKYDPDNFFRINQNIPPGSKPGRLDRRVGPSNGFGPGRVDET